MNKKREREKERGNSQQYDKDKPPHRTRTHSHSHTSAGRPRIQIPSSTQYKPDKGGRGLAVVKRTKWLPSRCHLLGEHKKKRATKRLPVELRAVELSRATCSSLLVFGSWGRGREREKEHK